MERFKNIQWSQIGPLAPPRDLELQGALINRLRDAGRLESFLRQAGHAHHAALLVVNDSHRATPTRRILEAIATVASNLDNAPEFRVLVATGTHTVDDPERRQFEESTFQGCGLEISGVEWHEADNRQMLVSLAGCDMNRLLAQHRFILPIGSVEPHYFAGATGAHKTLTIGCLSRDDIERNHAGAMSPESDLLRLDGNPVFDDMQRVLTQLLSEERHVLAVNTVVNGPRILDAAVGDPVETLRRLLPTVTRAFVHRIPSPVDVALLLVPLPLGRSLYQADKALKNCQGAVRAGGGMVLEAPCPEGVGADAFLRLLRRTQHYDIARQIVDDEGYRLGDHKAVKLLYLTDPKHRNVNVAVVSPNIDGRDLGESRIAVFTKREAALDWLAERLAGPSATGLRVQDAGVVGVMARRG